MPTIELLAEVQALREQLAQSDEAGRMYCKRTLDAESELADMKLAMDAAHWEIDSGLQAKAELAALKKDARIVAEFAIQQVHSVKLDKAMRRILEATKEQ